MADHPGMGLVDVYAAVLKDFTFEPTLHVHYETKTVSVKDRLPKFQYIHVHFTVHFNNFQVYDCKYISTFQYIYLYIWNDFT